MEVRENGFENFRERAHKFLQDFVKTTPMFRTVKRGDLSN